LPNYDLNFPADNYRRYFKYKDRTVNEKKKQEGICRKCNVKVPRTDGNTKGLKNHIEDCDAEAWDLLNKRKSKSAPSTPKQSTTQPITGFFEVSIFLILIFNFNLEDQ
jgi:hypothetical protein